MNKEENVIGVNQELGTTRSHKVKWITVVYLTK
jgi:hypothetical protein